MKATDYSSQQPSEVFLADLEAFVDTTNDPPPPQAARISDFSSSKLEVVLKKTHVSAP
ncbi:hypothetical protein FRUB_06012 [Fimbriiglobus ruber]|uniref:Uncharacterized protein n=1 Tax=Fimbriiglobus ruber TaxID=1908690 RepID=A0A225DQH5_9BACT|nr:hypothetical protein FRUB_06012 [Fimbriiglobus ruber]